MNPLLRFTSLENRSIRNLAQKRHLQNNVCVKKKKVFQYHLIIKLWVNLVRVNRLAVQNRYFTGQLFIVQQKKAL